MTRHLAAAVAFTLIVAGSSSGLHATMPPADGGAFPELMYTRMTEQPDSFTFRSGFINLIKNLQQNKFDLFSAGKDFDKPTKPFKLVGAKTIPLLMIQFADSGKEPFRATDLQRGIFDAPVGSGTVRDYYLEMSYGGFTLNGRVFGWKKLSKPQAGYAGGANCNGTCLASQVPAMVTEALSVSAEIDWSPFDNDGPDGKPNSGDDNGVVDFVGFVHPEKGGECQNNQNLWSHQSNLAKPFVTKTPRSGGGYLMVQDYVVAPALSCKSDSTALKMIEIGVFAHEFGHALGLPDLYSTDKTNASVGTGHWCLMGTGSWGGDGNSPERPTHMSAWAKSFLGWITPQVIATPRVGLKITSAEKTAVAFSTALGGSVYYLTERRDLSGTDSKLPASGLLQWRIDEAIVSQGLARNTVNNDPSNPGIRLVEADGSDDLLTGKSRAAAGDVFRAGAGTDQFDSSTSPRSEGTFAMCAIGTDGGSADLGLGGPCPLIPVPGRGARSASAGTGTSASRGTGSPLSSGGPGPKSNSQALTLTGLVRSAADLIDREITVSATIDNAGANFFTDRRLVLKDQDGLNAVAVELAGMIAEAVAPSRAGEPAAPPRLSDVLGKSVEVTGRLQRVKLADGTSTVVFVVRTLRQR